MGPFLDMLEKLLGSEWASVKRELADDTQVVSEAIRKLTNDLRLPRFSKIITTSAGMPGGTEQGGPIGLVAYLRHRISPAPHFLIDDALVNLLEHTDIAADIPLAMFNLPFRRFYVELGKSRTCQCTLPNSLSGDHVLEGAYVERGRHQEGEFLSVVLTGSPLGKLDATDDATLSLALPLSDPSRSIHDAILAAHQRAKSEAAPAGLAISPDAWANDALQAVLLLAKALLYIGMPGARRQLHPEKTEAIKALRVIKSTAKKVKAQRRIDRAYDYVLISPQPEHTVTAQQMASTTNVRAHWRRGHYRSQAHGTQLLLRKLIFIEPVLVGAQAKLTEPAVPNYRVI